MSDQDRESHSDSSFKPADASESSDDSMDGRTNQEVISDSRAKLKRINELKKKMKPLIPWPSNKFLASSTVNPSYFSSLGSNLRNSSTSSLVGFRSVNDEDKDVEPISNSF